MNAARNTLDAAALEATVGLLAARLDRHRGELNRLNVYPVADSDTGDNLVATVRAVSEQVVEAGPAGIIDAIATGALLGGRGSSGVMFGQALRGFVTRLPRACGGDGLASALTAAAASARKAIADPVEGTMLTVADDAARRARATAGASVEEVARAAAAEGRRSLLRTPELLPALAEAGVVDAGGLGYVLFLDALAEAITGVAAEPPQLPQPGRPAFECDGNGGGRYEVVCLVDAPEERLASLRERWLSLGDTVAIAGGPHNWRCHVHTDEVVAALSAVREAGPISEIEVTDLAEQANGSLSVVAVANCDEVAAAYLDAGARRVVVRGGAEASTGTVQRAIDACATPVVVFGDEVPEGIAARVIAVGALAGLLALDVVGPLRDGDVESLATRLEHTARQIRTVDVATPASGKSEDAVMAAAEAVVAPATTWALLAVDREAQAEDDAIDRLRRAHPHVKWLERRTNRPSYAYGFAVQ